MKQETVKFGIWSLKICKKADFPSSIIKILRNFYPRFARVCLTSPFFGSKDREFQPPLKCLPIFTVYYVGGEEGKVTSAIKKVGALTPLFFLTGVYLFFVFFLIPLRDLTSVRPWTSITETLKIRIGWKVTKIFQHMSLYPESPFHRHISMHIYSD